MVVNPSFGKNISLYQLHLFYLLDLRSSPLDICYLGEFVVLCVHDLCKLALESSPSRLCNWALNLHSIYSHYIYLLHSAMCVLGSSKSVFNLLHLSENL